MEDLFNNPFFVSFCLLAMLGLGYIMVFHYMPRIRELKRLQKIIARKDAKIKELSEDSAQAELEHIADIGQVSTELLTARCRKKQAEDRADQIARAADKLRVS